MDPEKPQMLYPFMQFLKSEAAVNVLQFALACGKVIMNSNFQKKIVLEINNVITTLEHWTRG